MKEEVTPKLPKPHRETLEDKILMLRADFEVEKHNLKCTKLLLKFFILTSTVLILVLYYMAIFS
jgi:hypothetical protein